MTRIAWRALASLFLIFGSFGAAVAEQRRAGDFDFYVLALSWSPSYCAAEGRKANRQQCDSGRDYDFVVHGLWPQYERGFPRECRTGNRRVSDGLARSMTDIMPSVGLINHEWRMHGTCSGLSQSDYFRLVRGALEKVSIPKRFQGLAEEEQVSASMVEAAFMKANAGLPEDGVSVSCEGKLLREVRICMTKDLTFRDCAQVERKACNSGGLRMPPVADQ